MISDMVPIVHRFPARENLMVYPISDLHFGAAECMEREWAMFCNRLLEEPKARLIIVGDMMNNGLKSSVSNVYEETCRPRTQKQWLTDQLGPVKDRILCITPGNHEGRSVKEADDNPLYDVACKLNIENIYRENMAFMSLRFGEQKGDGKKNPSYQICAIHGAGGGVTPGAAVNRNERFVNSLENVDAVIFGHSHQAYAKPVGKTRYDTHNGKVYTRGMMVTVCTSWLEYGGYGVRGMFSPTVHCLNQMELSGAHKAIKESITVNM